MTTIKLLANLSISLLMQAIKRKQRKRSKWVSERELRKMRRHIAAAKLLAKANNA